MAITSALTAFGGATPFLSEDLQPKRRRSQAWISNIIGANYGRTKTAGFVAYGKINSRDNHRSARCHNHAEIHNATKNQRSSEDNVSYQLRSLTTARSPSESLGLLNPVKSGNRGFYKPHISESCITGRVANRLFQIEPLVGSLISQSCH